MTQKSKCKHQFWKDRNPPGCMNCGKTEDELYGIVANPLKQENIKKTYTAYIICRNCDYGKPYMAMNGGYEIEFPRGKKVEDMPCPNCGCKELINSKPN